MSDPLYVLDTSVFIQAHRLHYPFDVTPAFWDALLESPTAAAWPVST